MTKLHLTIHRAAHEIGGNCIEIGTNDGHRIILDAGRPLDAQNGSIADLLPKSLDISRPTSAVLLSHAHQDHYGLLSALPSEWKICCGSASGRLIRLTAGISRESVRQSFTEWVSEKPIQIGPFTVTPYLTDHSAFDAYMILVEAYGTRILYSGDFRMHGRKSTLVTRMMKVPPSNIDVLILEGTNLGSSKSCVSEASLESQFIDLFKATQGRVFVAWSAQNIDRLVTLYRACLQTGRTLAVDLYTAEVLDLLCEFGKLPRPGWKSLKVVITSSFARMYKNTGREKFVNRMVKNGISAKELASGNGRWAIMIRPSLIRDYEFKNVRPTKDDSWSWSMWRGYLENEDGKRVKAWFEDHGCTAIHIHTSGHASPNDLRRFANCINPRKLIPVHGLAWDGDTEGFPNVTRLADGITLAL